MTTDAYGEEIPTWETIAQEWVQPFYGRGNERREAAAERGELPANFVALENERTRLVNVKDRVVAENRVWDIVGIAPAQGGKIEFTAIASDAPAGVADVIGFPPSDGDGLSLVGTELRVDIEELPGV
jgi:head-tail adaptor